MTQNNEKWIPHLVNAVPSKGYGKRLSSFSIALEGWRRGLELTFYNSPHPENKLRIQYVLSSDSRTHHFHSSLGDKVTDEAYEICNNKHLTKKYLNKLNVPNPKGDMFEENIDDSEIIKYANDLGYPLVLKPTDANGGRGVFSNLKSESSLKDALHHVRTVLGYKEVIIEEYLPGVEYRIIVLEDKVVGALNRVPANVIGDGMSTIRELIRIKNKERKQNPHLKSRMIKIDDEVRELLYLHGYTLDTIPREGEVVTLRLTSNLSTGGDSVDITDKLTPELIEIAVNATKAVPGLNLSGIDMIVDLESNKGKVIEVNTRPGLGGHLFPLEGTPRDIPSMIIDHYFPETQNEERSLLYFDFDAILEPLQKRTAISIRVPDLPRGIKYGSKFIISGDFDRRKYRVWLRRQGFLLEMHGFIETHDNGDIEAVFVTSNKNNLKKIRELCLEGPENTNVKIDDIKEYKWNEPVKIGVEVRREKLTPKEVKEIEKENIRIQRENERLTKKYSQIRNSRAWRATYPIRTILQRGKNIFRKFK